DRCCGAVTGGRSRCVLLEARPTTSGTGRDGAHRDTATSCSTAWWRGCGDLSSTPRRNRSSGPRAGPADLHQPESRVVACYRQPHSKLPGCRRQRRRWTNASEASSGSTAFVEFSNHRPRRRALHRSAQLRSLRFVGGRGNVARSHWQREALRDAQASDRRCLSGAWVSEHTVRSHARARIGVAARHAGGRRPGARPTSGRLRLRVYLAEFGGANGRTEAVAPYWTRQRSGHSGSAPKHRPRFGDSKRAVTYATLTAAEFTPPAAQADRALLLPRTPSPAEGSYRSDRTAYPLDPGRKSSCSTRSRDPARCRAG